MDHLWHIFEKQIVCNTKKYPVYIIINIYFSELILIIFGNKYTSGCRYLVLIVGYGPKYHYSGLWFCQFTQDSIIQFFTYTTIQSTFPTCLFKKMMKEDVKSLNSCFYVICMTTCHVYKVLMLFLMDIFRIYVLII